MNLDLESCKVCWDKLKPTYQVEVLVYHHNIYMEFASFGYEHEPIEVKFDLNIVLSLIRAQVLVSLFPSTSKWGFLGIVELHYTCLLSKRDQIHHDTMPCLF